jgi:subtilisin family serine protease
MSIKNTITALIFILPFFAFSQSHNWQHDDLIQDSIFGISTNKAYAELLSAKNKKLKPVVVAVIDSGVDTAHLDLKDVLWNNKRESKPNGRDDDHDGYIDDRHGWNFIGSSKGNVDFDNLELTRIIRKEKGYWDSVANTGVPASLQPGFYQFQAISKHYEQEKANATNTLNQYQQFKNALLNICSAIGKPNPSATEWKSYAALTDYEKHVTNTLQPFLENGTSVQQFIDDKLNGTINYFTTQVNYYLNLDFDPRPVVGDNYFNTAQRIYGNNDVTGPDAEHGTHVAGIIAASRYNDLGIQGIADAVRIMSIRTVPNGDERDKDVANAILYAADHGAKVINMSFGKAYSPYKDKVDQAIKYAISKDVLLIHAAGNEGKNLDKEKNYPTKLFNDSTLVSAWLEVGASGPKDDSTLVASFSNWGKTTVDVFAPGVQIYSCIPGSSYASIDGTSMAAPVVTGLAALIRSRYPKLTAIQVKDIIMQSVQKVDHTVIVKDNGIIQHLPFQDVCVSGGVVNAYNALILAESYNKKR